MEFVDKEKTCKDCGGLFVLTASEQKFFASKELSEPVRCPACRLVKRQKKEQEAREGMFQGGDGQIS